MKTQSSRIAGPVVLAIAASLWASVNPARAANLEQRSLVIVRADDASPLEDFAAREVRRYLYLRSGVLVPIAKTTDRLASNADLIVVGEKRQPILRALGSRAGLGAEVMLLAGDEYRLKTFPSEARRVWLLAGGSEVGALYAAYRFAECLGVRFYLHGDAIPDRKMRLSPALAELGKGAEDLGLSARPERVGLPDLDESGKPLFALRGIQPFHDFPEGPDWWERDDYLAIIAQLPKLRMNFFGLHTYPEKRPNAEPTVWIGLAQDVDPAGRVRHSYPASYQNTLRGNWGYEAKKTGDYSFGAGDLFARDGYGPAVMGQWIPSPNTPEACNEVFDNTGRLLSEVFSHARRLGVKTCVGTETPLVVPEKVKERLKQLGQDPSNPAMIEELYAGMFTRISRTHPLDYYWFWTPEGWTWEGTKPEQIAATTNDLAAAIRAWKAVQPDFRLATCGWVLGPQQDRALFDKVLPRDVAISCINREVGKTPIEKGFAQVQGRGKWAIPWLEDDPALTAPQLWVGRMRRDAFDALAYGCDGLMGIHWRSRILGPAVSALAQAAWTQQPWARQMPSKTPSSKKAGVQGGKQAHFPNNQIADTGEAAIYQSVRYQMSAYRLAAPKGAYAVTLKFCEPHYKAAGKRVFSVALQGTKVIENLDIFARVGKDHPLDFRYENVQVTNGWLELEFIPQTEYPSIAGIVVQSATFTNKINCGGAAYKDYAADWPQKPDEPPGFPPVDDFYLDWAGSHFGPEIAVESANLFALIDGRLHRPADWVNGPGGIKPDNRPWAEVSTNYAFVREFAALRPRVRGRGNLERFDYWLSTFEYMQAMARLNCTWAKFTNALGQAKAQKDAGAREAWARTNTLPLRIEMVGQLTAVYNHLLATVSNPGELGTVANWEQHLLPGLIEKPGKELAGLLGGELPEDARLRQRYVGPARLIVPTRRTSLLRGESLRLKAIVLSEQPPETIELAWRPMGQGAYRRVPFQHVGRGVHSVTLAADTIPGDLEYFVRAVVPNEPPLHYPATAPDLNATVVLQAR